MHKEDIVSQPSTSIAHRTGWYFLAALGGPILGLLSLPLYTMRLDAVQFGIFALGSSLATVVSATAGSVCSLSLPAELHRLEVDNKRRYVGAVIAVSLLTAFACCIAVFTLYFAVASFFTLELLSINSTVLCIVGGLFGSLWSICVEIMAIEGRARSYTMTAVLQMLANVVAVCIALFLFDDLENALFWGLQRLELRAPSVRVGH